MARYINAELIDFNEVFVGASDFARDTREAAQMLIDHQPTADVVEVIRCKDCIYRWFNGVNLHTCVRDTANGEPIVNLEDFCSYGKKVEHD